MPGYILSMDTMRDAPMVQSVKTTKINLMTIRTATAGKINANITTFLLMGVSVTRLATRRKLFSAPSDRITVLWADRTSVSACRTTIRDFLPSVYMSIRRI